MQQLLLTKNELRAYKRYTHGGVSLKKRRKIKRPLVPGRTTHVVFKSSKARGDLSFYRNKKVVVSLLNERAKKFFVEVKDFVNMGNHIHLKVRFKDAEMFKNFLRTFPGLLARRLTNSHRGTKFGGRFWDGLVYTRILFTRFEELGLKIYFSGNQTERDLGYRERSEYLRQWNQYLYKLKATRARVAPA
jgi:REP element-mobilizing transposase RayT